MILLCLISYLPQISQDAKIVTRDGETTQHGHKVPRDGENSQIVRFLYLRTQYIFITFY